MPYESKVEIFELASWSYGDVHPTTPKRHRNFGIKKKKKTIHNMHCTSDPHARLFFPRFAPWATVSGLQSMAANIHKVHQMTPS